MFDNLEAWSWSKKRKQVATGSASIKTIPTDSENEGRGSKFNASIRMDFVRMTKLGKGIGQSFPKPGDRIGTEAGKGPPYPLGTAYQI